MPIRSNLSKVLVAVSVVSAFGCGGSVATLEYVGVLPVQPKIGDVSTVTFKLTDYRGVPLAGTNVTFKLDFDKPGVTLSPLSAISLKGTGEASTQLVVSSRVTSVIVIATAGDKVVRSPPISVAGSNFASGRQFTFQCGQISGNGSGGRHAIGAYDQSRNLIAGVKLECTAHVADRNGDGIPGASVSFLAEAGTIGPSETSVADVIGNAKILYKTSFPIPADVVADTFTWTPLVDENHTGAYLVPLWMEPYNWTSNPILTLTSNMPPFNKDNLQEPRRPDPFRKRPDGMGFYQMNSRDNLVAMIAFTSGEEGFTDSDNDGKFTKAGTGGAAVDEIFDDLTEPFVDNNDNGTWDIDEKFIDFNGDLKWNGKNNAWDGNTLIWAQERILWTGIPDARDLLPPFPVARPFQSDNGQPIQISCFGGAGVNLVIGDPWFNSMARNSESDGCRPVGDPVVVKVVGGGTGGVFTYPAISSFGLLLTDALDRKPQPMTNPAQPGCFPPPGGVCTPGGSDCYLFGVSVLCAFTASPLDGHVVNLIDTIVGRIFKNLP